MWNNALNRAYSDMIFRIGRNMVIIRAWAGFSMQGIFGFVSLHTITARAINTGRGNNGFPFSCGNRFFTQAEWDG